MPTENTKILESENKSMLRIGIIGLGNISQKHINEILKSDKAKISAICDIDKAKLSSVGDKLGIDENCRFENYIDLIKCDKVDAVEICTPNHLHIPMAMEAAKANKPVEVEKPLSIDYAGVDRLVEEINSKNIPNMMCFSYRFMPAVRYAKDILSKGKIGKIINVNVEYLKDSAFFNGRRLEWRFVKKYAGSGVLGDLGVHLIDMTRFLVGDFENVYAMKNIVVDKRKKLDSEEIADVETDDIISFIAKLGGSVIANFMVTRCAIGNKNTIKYEIYGTDGVIVFNLNNPQEITLCFATDRENATLETLAVPKEYFVGQEETFIETALGNVQENLPDINEGAACQRIVDALLKSSETGIPVKIK